MLKVEDGIARLGILIVSGGCVYKGLPRFTARRRVPAHSDFAVRHILQIVKTDAWVRNLDAAPDIAGAEETLAVRIRHRCPIDGYRVVVEPRVERPRCAGPITGFPFCEIRIQNANTLGVGRVNAERCSSANPPSGTRGRARW